MNGSPTVVNIKEFSQKKRIKEMAESMFMIGWFRILPEKGEHQATNYNIAIRQYFRKNTIHFQV